ncbi:MAG: thymidine phosphorylase [Lachnospiraceae bacterium]
MNMYELIDRKKNNGELKRKELYYIVNGYTNGDIPDYQMAAFLMAVCFNGMSEEETYNFTMAMKESGDELDLSGIKGAVVDKHSTGGVGDKVSLVMGPMVAACGVPVAKMSGRGLGYTGGTIDKLESFTGFNTSPSVHEFIKNVNDIGISWAGQTANLAPADKKIYALRDVTATVDSMPLIASSIMSKKLAAGAAGIVLDVTYGTGAFMENPKEAEMLARLMIKIGRRQGKKMAAVITDMNEPLGCAVGNSIEVIEAINVLNGKGPDSVLEVALVLGSHMLLLNGRCSSLSEAKALLLNTIKNGSALKKMAQWVERQGGNGEMVYNTELFKKAAIEKQILYTGKDGESENRGMAEYVSASN